MSVEGAMSLFGGALGGTSATLLAAAAVLPEQAIEERWTILALLATIIVVGGRWAGNRLVKSLDANTKAVQQMVIVLTRNTIHVREATRESRAADAAAEEALRGLPAAVARELARMRETGES